MASESIVIEHLNSLLEARHDALPSNFNKMRFVQNCKSYLPEVKGLNRHNDDGEIALLLFNGAVLGLDFLNKECHVISDNGKISFQTDYKGEKKLVKKHSVRPVQDIYAKNVREGDGFREEIIDGKPTIYFNPLPFNNSKIIGSFAVALFTDGGMIYETMTAEEIELIRKVYGKNANSSAWENSQGEMNKRTVLRRLCKSIETDMDAVQTIAFEAGGEFEFNKEPRPQQQSPFNASPKLTENESDEVVLDEVN